MKLTERQHDVLESLFGFRGRSHITRRTWARPLDVGGHSRSHHSATLNQLVAKGLVELREQPIHMMRPPKYYRINRAGVEALGEEWIELT